MDAHAAYEALPPGWKLMLDGLDAIHDIGTFRNDFLKKGGVSAVNEALKETGSAVHKVKTKKMIAQHRRCFLGVPPVVQHVLTVFFCEYLSKISHCLFCLGRGNAPCHRRKILRRQH